MTPKPRVEVVVKDRIVVLEPDPSLRGCMARITRRPIENQSQIAQLIADLFEVGDDCRAKHDATWQSIDQAKAKLKAAEQQKDQ